VSATIHWSIAALLLAQFPVGFYFHSLDHGAAREQWFTWHKTIGLAVLLLTIFQLGWRILWRPPPPPRGVPRWQLRLVATSHVAFYFLLLIIPLSGLLAVSAWFREEGVTHILGGLTIPVIPGVSRDLGNLGEEQHKFFVGLLLWLIALHVAAAAKHQLFPRTRPNLASRMPPFRL
jgi:cytochrome b561